MTRFSKTIMLSTVTAFLASGQANASDLENNALEQHMPGKAVKGSGKTVRWEESVTMQDFDKKGAPQEITPAGNSAPVIRKSILKKLNASIQEDKAKLKILESMPMHATKAGPRVTGVDGRKVTKNREEAEKIRSMIAESILRAKKIENQLKEKSISKGGKASSLTPRHAKKAFDGTRAMKGREKGKANAIAIDGRKGRGPGKN